MSEPNLLHRYFEEQSPAASEAALETVIRQQADPLIRKIVRSKLAFRRDVSEADFEDVGSEALVALLSSLDDLRESRGEPIADFDAFVAVITYRACSDYLRRKYPEFHRLRNRLRYLLNSNPNLSIWQIPAGEWLCGLASKSGERAISFDETAAVAELRGAGSDPARLLPALFSFAGSPVVFDNAVRILALCLGVVERAEHEAGSIPLADPSPLPDAAPQRREWIERLWSEILELPPKQRAALLLNLRDEGGACATTVFIASGVAGLPDLASALDMPVSEFMNLWRGMPLEDLQIAERLGLTRQQVINLRKCARERLARRIFSRKAVQPVIKGSSRGHT